MPRLLISTGEASGELYAAGLIDHLRPTVPDLEVVGLGGDRLQARGARLLAHIHDMAVVGPWEVVAHLSDLRRIFHAVLAEVDRTRPDVAVLVDYPDFNLRLAAELRRRGVPVVYYVSPQVWAWRPGRVKQIQRTVDLMLVIFPFEESFYADSGVRVRFVGHPLVDLVRPHPDPSSVLREAGLDPSRPVVALLPGSRRKEVAHHLAPLAGTVDLLHRQRPDLQFLAAVAPGLDPAPLHEAFAGLPMAWLTARAHDVLSAAAVAVVASGTATVETALLGVPMVVVYRLSPLTYLLGRPFVRVPHYAMVNLIAGRAVVPELIQGGFTPAAVGAEVRALLEDPARAARMREDLAGVRARLGDPGGSARAAEAVRPYLVR